MNSESFLHNYYVLFYILNSSIIILNYKEPT